LSTSAAQPGVAPEAVCNENSKDMATKSAAIDYGVPEIPSKVVATHIQPRSDTDFNLIYDKKG